MTNLRTNMLDKNSALNAISNLISKISDLEKLAENSLEFQKWKYKAENQLLYIFGPNSTEYKAFHKELFPNKFASSYGSPYKDYSAIYRKTLSDYNVQLLGLKAQIELWPDKRKEEIDYIDKIIGILNNFHSFARQLKIRHENRQTININDEYDVQDLLHAILKLHFKDVRSEEYTPSYAGSASRVDFLLKDEKVFIEVKKTRKSLKDKELGEQLAIDKVRYQSHPDCRTLICFIYDPEELIINPMGLEHDLGSNDEKFSIYVVVTPKP